jgi:DNA-binding transcriptional MerR regulator
MTYPSSPALIRARVAADRLGKHPRTLARWSEQGILPEPIRLGPRGDRHYRTEDIDAVLREGATHD